MGKGSKTSVSTAPDPAVGAAAMKEAELGQDWLAESKKQYQIANVRQDKLDAISNEVSAQQLAASKEAQTWGEQDRARSVGVFRPLQDKFIQKAQDWDSPGRAAGAAAEAAADVRRNAGIADATEARQMAAMGVNPASGRYAGIDRSSKLQTALGVASAENGARSTVRNQAMGLMGDAINLGSGLGVNPATSLGLGGQLGSQAQGTQLTANQANTANLSILKSGYDTAMQGYNAQANILSTQRGQNIQLAGQQAQQQASNQSSTMGAIGSIAGVAVMAF
jgi:hypothetical protein